jgi:hypothetical protein
MSPKNIGIPALSTLVNLSEKGERQQVSEEGKSHCENREKGDLRSENDRLDHFN